MKKTVKKMAMGGPVGGMPTQAAAGLARRPASPGNAGGAMRGLERAAAMSGRTFDQGQGYAKGGMIGFKACKACPNPAKCAKAGKCVAKAK
jgi:hypothetical protein